MGYTPPPSQNCVIGHVPWSLGLIGLRDSLSLSRSAHRDRRLWGRVRGDLPLHQDLLLSLLSLEQKKAFMISVFRVSRKIHEKIFTRCWINVGPAFAFCIYIADICRQKIHLVCKINMFYFI